MLCRGAVPRSAKATELVGLTAFPRLDAAHRERPGLGPARRRALLTHFGGLQGVMRAGAADLEKVTGVGAAMARSIYDHLHPGS